MEITRKSFKAYLKDIELHTDDEDMSGLKINISEAGMKIDVTFVDERPKIMSAEDIEASIISWDDTEDYRISIIQKGIDEGFKRHKPLVDELEKLARSYPKYRRLLNLIIKKP